MITEKQENILLKLKYWINKKKYEETCQSNYLIDSITPLLINIERTPESRIDNEVVDMAYDIAYYNILIIEYLEHNFIVNEAKVE